MRRRMHKRMKMRRWRMQKWNEEEKDAKPTFFDLKDDEIATVNRLVVLGFSPQQVGMVCCVVWDSLAV